MRRPLHFLAFCGALFWGTTLLGQQIELTLRYNLALSRFEVYARPTASNPTFTWGPSQISLLIPASVPNGLISITSANAGAWADTPPVYAPAADPAHDFHGVGSGGAPTNLVAGQELLLFHFSLPGGNCVPGLRLFINGSDPDSSAPGMLGGDFSNTIDNGMLTDVYIGNYNNLGTVSSPQDTINATICEGETYVLGNKTFTSTGTYADTIDAAVGCDTMVTLNLTVLPHSRDTIDVSICEGDFYTFDAQNLTATGTYSDTLVAANGCDSIITLNLNVLPSARDSISTAICEGTTYTFGAQILSAAGIYSDTLIEAAANGCDSIITLTLSILPISRDTLNEAICEGTTYSFDGQNLGTAGTYSDTLTAANGCDSIITLNLSILPIIRDTLEVSICEGETYTFDGDPLDDAGTYTATFVAANGCDSIVTLNLSVLPIIRDTLDVSICEGTTYTFDGQNLSVAGSYQDTLTAANTCDSIITLNLTILPISRDTISASICEGSTYTFDGQALSAAGTYADTLTAANGCDSILTLNLSILPISRDTISASICEGTTYTFDGQTLSAAGTYADTLTAANGCDSIITLNLNVLPIIRDTLEVSICEGTTYTFATQTLSAAGTYSDTLTAANTCDSIVTLNLSILPIVRDTLDVSICEGETYTFGGEPLNVAGTYSDTLTAANTCDSIVTLNLSILPIVEDTISASICEGETYTLGAQVLNTAGTYVETFTAANGCDSIVTLNLSIRPLSRDTILASICEGDSYTFGNQTLSTAGTYENVLTAANDCDSIVTLILDVLPASRNTIRDTIIIGGTYDFGGELLSEAGTYLDTLVAANSCDSILTLILTVIDTNDVTCGCYDLSVSLDTNCQFVLTPRHISDGYCANAYVRVMDNDPSNVDTIDCAGVWMYGLFDADGNLICWGRVTAEDKTGPSLLCTNWNTDTLDCFDVNYVLNNRLTIGNVAATSSPRPSASSAQTILNAEGIPGDDGDATCDLVPPALVPDNVLNLGYTYFEDNCRDCGCRTTVKWNDRVLYYNCEQMAANGGIYARIYRTWTATDCNGMIKDTVQEINFKRPALEDFVFKNENPEGNYDHVVTYNACAPDKSLIKKEDVTPYVCSYFNTSDNPRCLYIDQVECNYSVQIKDTEFPICGGKGLKIDREMYIFDWCAGGIIDTLHILIKIGDFEAPTLEYAHHAPYDLSTGPMDCTASFPISAAGLKSSFGVEVKDNCTLANISVKIKTKDRYVKGILVAENVWEQVDYAVMNGVVIGLPVGRHRLIIDASDGCYNAKRDSFEFNVIDKIAPVMKCDDDLHVTLSNANGYTNGYAQVSAADIDEGSWDNCKMAWIAVRRNVPASCEASFVQKGYDSNGNGKLDAAPFDDPKDAPANFDWSTVDGVDNNGDGDIRDFGEFVATKGGKKMTPLLDFVEFFCCDQAERVTVELWGEDTAGNRNYCWMDLLIEDKVAPTCIAPWDVTIDCDDKNIGLIDDKVASSKLWGDVTITTGNDCGALDTVYTTTKTLKCGSGKIVRNWALTKQTAKGPITITCSQTIWIRPIRMYNICFPKDATTDCKTPNPDTVIVDELACDLLAVNVSDKRYDATGDECYKIFRTYTVINWCAYDDKCGDPMAEGNVFVVDRGLFLNNGAAPIYVLVRDDDRDLNEEFYLSTNLTPNEPLASNKRSGDYHVLGDPDRNSDGNGTGYNSTEYSSFLGEPAGTVTMPYCEAYDLAQDPFQSWEYYHSFMYTQIIKVYDSERPVVTGIRDTFCTNPSLCTANITKVVNLKDNCSDKVSLETQYLMIAPFQTTAAGSMILYSTPRWSTKDLGNGNYEISVSNLPEGTHDLIVVGRDECGNLSVATRIPFVVKDCKAPAPICINGLSTELMPDGNGGGMMAVWAKDFVASPIYDCNGQGPETKDGLKVITKYSINRVGETPRPDQSGLTFNCSDKGEVVLVELHAWDEAGNHDFCVTYVEVQDNRSNCVGSVTNAEISGLISTDELEPVFGVSIDLSGGAEREQNTASNGTYTFKNLSRGNDYTVAAQLDKDHINGVSTFDLVLIQKHILGVKTLDSPYRMIAADVNNSRSISTLDMIQIRKLILNIDTRFNNVPSWKFVDASYSFPQANNPWSAAFPEVVNVNDLDGKIKADFVAVKMGDVNGNASTNGLVASETRGAKHFNLSVDEQMLQAGQNYEVAIRAKDLATIQGFQFSLNMASELELVGVDYGLMSAEHLALFPNQGLLTASFNSVENLPAQAVLFTLKLKAKTATKLSEVLNIVSRPTTVEAYNQQNEVMGIQLKFDDLAAEQVILYQNSPNPFADETSIEFYLPKAEQVVLSVRDAKGAMLYQLKQSYPKGTQRVWIKREDLQSSGVLYYTLQTSDANLSQKMILLIR